MPQQACHTAFWAFFFSSASCRSGSKPPPRRARNAAAFSGR
jgi:hypothetical protein